MDSSDSEYDGAENYGRGLEGEGDSEYEGDGESEYEGEEHHDSEYIFADADGMPMLNNAADWQDVPDASTKYPSKNSNKRSQNTVCKSALAQSLAMPIGVI